VECYVSQSDSEYFLAFVVFATFAVIGIMTIATVADGGKAVAVDMVILKIAFNSGIISAGKAKGLLDRSQDSRPIWLDLISGPET